jgi:carbon monoxide dehydrogenase subunit G
VWAALIDFERVVPCMPGAEVLERKGDDAYQVQVRVKVGPMSMTYRGVVEITERDETALKASMRVQARETRGQGTANATVDIALAQDGAGTEATMATDVRLSGRAASMGRGVINDVSQALIAEFAGNLARLLAEEGEAAPASADQPAASSPAAASEPAPPPGPAALDAGQLARSVVAGRLRDPRTAVSALVAAACMAIGFVFGRSRR